VTIKTYTVAELLGEIDQAIASVLPGPIWVRGEVSGLRRTSGGAAFFRLADAELDETALEVSARGRVMFEIDKQLDATGLGALKDGIELRARGTVVIDHRQSRIRLSLLEIDPTFTAGRLAMLRAEVLRRLSADGSLDANSRLPLPLVPQRIGLVTSRGSAAHADFIDHLRSSQLRFEVKTAHTMVQGEGADQAVARSISRVGREQIDMIALIRGGGSKLDLAVFDSEPVGRAIAKAPVPVVTGIGHEIDRTVADEAAAVYQKTPTAASEWIVTTVTDFAARIDSARQHIKLEARHFMTRADGELAGLASALRGTRVLLDKHGVRLDHLRDGIVDSARSVVSNEKRQITSLSEWFSTVGVDRTLERGFALVTAPDGSRVIRSVDELAPGDRAVIRFADGTVPVVVETE
jgi:exodeoxyribonuclease VII large subunit